VEASIFEEEQAWTFLLLLAGQVQEQVVGRTLSPVIHFLGGELVDA